MRQRLAIRFADRQKARPAENQEGALADHRQILQMIAGVIFDFDNTLMDFMKMKRAAVEAAVDSMIDAGLPYKKTEMIEKIYKVYWQEGIEDQFIFDKVLMSEFGKIDYK